MITGVAISSDSLRIHFFVPTSQLQRERPIVNNPRTIRCDVFLVTFQQKSYS